MSSGMKKLNSIRKKIFKENRKDSLYERSRIFLEIYKGLVYQVKKGFIYES